MTDVTTFSDEKIVALTLWGEIRGGSTAQKLNVANVIRNRVRARLRREGDNRPDWWGEGWRGVCLARAQFSCWFDAQRDRMMELPETDRQYQGCLSIARRVMAGRDPDPTGGATHYHTIAVPPGATRWPPNWGAVLQHETLRDGLHVFYRDPAARFPEDAVGEIASTTPDNNRGPLANLAVQVAAAIVALAGAAEPFRNALDTVGLGPWTPYIALACAGVGIGLAGVWLYRRIKSRQAVAP